MERHTRARGLAGTQGEERHTRAHAGTRGAGKQWRRTLAVLGLRLLLQPALEPRLAPVGRRALLAPLVVARLLRRRRRLLGRRLLGRRRARRRRRRLCRGTRRRALRALRRQSRRRHLRVGLGLGVLGPLRRRRARRLRNRLRLRARRLHLETRHARLLPGRRRLRLLGRHRVVPREGRRLRLRARRAQLLRQLPGLLGRLLPLLVRRDARAVREPCRFRSREALLQRHHLRLELARLRGDVELLLAHHHVAHRPRARREAQRVVRLLAVGAGGRHAAHDRAEGVAPEGALQQPRQLRRAVGHVRGAVAAAVAAAALELRLRRLAQLLDHRAEHEQRLVDRAHLRRAHVAAGKVLLRSAATGLGRPAAVRRGALGAGEVDDVELRRRLAEAVGRRRVAARARHRQPEDRVRARRLVVALRARDVLALVAGEQQLLDLAPRADARLAQVLHGQPAVAPLVHRQVRLAAQQVADHLVVDLEVRHLQRPARSPRLRLRRGDAG